MNKCNKKIITMEKDKLDLTKGIGSMLSLINEYGIFKTFMSVILIAFTIIVISIALNPSKLIDYVSKYMKEQHDAGIEKRLEVSPKINGILSSMQSKLGATRTFVFEAHNGTSNLSGLPFLFVDMSYEVTDPETRPINLFYKNFSIENHPAIQHVYNNEGWSGTVEDLIEIDPHMARIMQANSMKYIAIICIYGSNTPFIGFIGVSFDHFDDMPDINVVHKSLSNSAQLISQLLDAAR